MPAPRSSAREERARGGRTATSARRAACLAALLLAAPARDAVGVPGDAVAGPPADARGAPPVPAPGIREPPPSSGRSTPEPPEPVAPGSIAPGPIVMEAPAGEFSRYDLPSTPVAGRVAVSLSIESVHEGSDWAPSAYFGLRNADDSVRFRVFLFQRVPGGPLLAGFDYVEGERLVDRTAVLTDLPVGRPVVVDLAWEAGGAVRFAFVGTETREYPTTLATPIAFAAVGSAKATFTVRDVAR